VELALVKKITFVFVPGLYGVKVPFGSRRTVWRLSVLGENLEDFASLIREQTIIGHDDSSAASGLQDRHHVLDEIQLLIARGDREVVSCRCLIRTPWCRAM